MEEENVKSIGEYLDVLYRRKGLILTTFLVIGVLGVLLALKLPPVYRSSATILIEDQQIPQSMVATTITDFADKRIELIKQRVMTRDRILSIIQKHKLYLDERNKMVPSELVSRFQEDTEISMISANVADPRQRGGKVTIAFMIAFNDENPQLAQAVVNELVSLFLNENTRSRTQRAAKTTDFMKDEADKLEKEIAVFESQLKDFKTEHLNSLPEMLTTNMSAIDRAREALRQTDSDIRSTRDRIAYLTDALLQAKDEVPELQSGKPLSKNEQLRFLKSQYIQLSSLYTAKHPDTLRVKRQIQNLDPEFTGEGSEDEVSRELEQAIKQLTIIEDKYSSSHPSVIKQKQKVTSLQLQLDQTSAEATRSDEVIDGSAHYVSLAGQLRAAEHELTHLLNLRDEFNRSMDEIQENIDKTPLVEKEYQELMRSRQTSINKFAELEAKYRAAKLAQTLEEEQKGEAFTLIEPPIAPEKPEKPNRKKIMVLGFGTGLGLGVGLSILLEMLREVIRGPKALERLTGMQPIVVIPYIDNPQDIARRKKRVKWIWIGSLLMLITAIAITHFLIMPLELVWAKVLFKVARL